MSGRLAAICALAVLVAAARPAAARDPEVAANLDAARSQKAALKYGDALATLMRTLELGKSGPAELTEIYRMAGELAGGLGDGAAAERHFAALLALAPDATLPPGTSPKIAEPFAAARARVTSALRVRFEASAQSLTLIVEADPLGLVAGARARVRRGRPDVLPAANPSLLVEARGTGSVVLGLPAGRLWVVASALDAHGNELIVHGSWEVPIQLGAAAPAPPEDARPQRSVFTRWWLWGGLAVVVGGVGLYFGDRVRGEQRDFDALVKDSPNHDFSEADAVASRGHRDALIANSCFVVAGLAGAASVLFLVRDAHHERATRVTPAVGPQLMGLAVWHSF